MLVTSIENGSSDINFKNIIFADSSKFKQAKTMSSSTLLDEMFQCVDKIGYSKTLNGIRQLQFDKIKFDDPRLEFVVRNVSEKVGVIDYEIMYGSGRKNERRFAIGLCAYYLHSSEYYGLDMDAVGKLLNKKPNLCYIYSKEVAKLNPNYKSDQKMIKIKNELDPIFKKHSKK